jgi:glycine dehydrogenase subunit 2
MHEFILTLKKEARKDGIKAFDVAKRLLDFGIHAPTVYFPLLVPECLLIEPTENETKATLDRFIEVMEQIRREMETDKETLTHAPVNRPTGRLDDVRAAKQLNVCCSVESR